MSHTSTLGHYQILKTLGTGATATVKLARSDIDDSLVAIKIFEQGNCRVNRNDRKLISEATLQIQLKHKNIIRAESMLEREIWHKPNGLSCQVSAIVSEYAEKGSLCDIILESGPLP